MARPLTVAGASLPRGPSVLRVSYSRPPRAADPADPSHAVSAAAYSLVGPSQASVVSVSVVDGDARSFDLALTGPLLPGTWVAVVSGVAAPDGEPLSAPASATVAVPASIARDVSPGASTPGPEALLYRTVAPSISGPRARALVAGLAAGASLVSRAAQFTRRQASVRTASGRYLDSIGSSVGVTRPDGVGLGDDLYRNLIPLAGAGRSGRLAALGVLEILYGEESVRSVADSAWGGPFVLEDGDDLLVLDGAGPAARISFSASDFTAIDEATSAEVAAAIDRSLRLAGSRARAVPHADPTTGATLVRLVAGALGLGSRISVVGGRAQRQLLFPSALLTTDSGTARGVAAGESWGVAVPHPGTARFTVSGPASDVDLSVVHPGDVAVIYGSPVAAANRGSFPITAVDVRYAGATLVQYFEVVLSGAQAQSFTSAGEDDVIFFRPTPAPPRGAVVSQAGLGQSVVLPATSRAVQRSSGVAAYLHAARPLETSAARRLGDGTFDVVFAQAHGLSVGNRVSVDDFVPATEPPTPAPGNGSTILDASTVTTMSSAEVADADFPALQRGGAAELADGDAYVAGGLDGTGAPSTRAGRVRNTGATALPDGSAQYHCAFVPAAALSAARYDCTATLLTDPVQGGKVFVAGGTDDASPITATELFDPGTDTYSAGPALAAERYAHAAVRLGNGRVLLVGGVSAGTSAATTDVYDPASGTASAGPALSDPRSRCAAVPLPDGRILVVGGIDYSATAGLSVPLAAPLGLDIAGDTDGAVLATCEVFDGAAWSRTGRMAHARVLHQVAVLPGGAVLACGGYGYPAGRPDAAGYLSSCEVWDPQTGRWSPAPSMRLARARHVSATVQGRVFVAGGEQGGKRCAEVFDPASRTWATSVAGTSAVEPDRSGGALLLLQDIFAWVGSYDTSEGAPDPATEAVYFLVPASDTFARGGNSAEATVSAVTSPTEALLTVDAGSPGRAVSSTAASLTPLAAPDAGGVPGPYLFEPTSGVALAGPSTTTTADALAGARGGILQVDDASDFPDEPGYLALDFGAAGQVAPVPYLRRLEASQILLDPSSALPRDALAGTTVDLLAGRAPLDPSDIAGSFWLTASSAGRVAAGSTLARLRAAGIPAAVTVAYPGDRGLGNEGEPARGAAKLTDAVAVWAGDDEDAEVATLREA